MSADVTGVTAHNRSHLHVRPNHSIRCIPRLHDTIGSARLEAWALLLLDAPLHGTASEPRTAHGLKPPLRGKDLEILACMIHYCNCNASSPQRKFHVTTGPFFRRGRWVLLRLWPHISFQVRWKLEYMLGYCKIMESTLVHLLLSSIDASELRKILKKEREIVPLVWYGSML